MSDARPRRGWRELVEPGIYRRHFAACKSTKDEKPGRRCGCPWAITGVGRNATLDGSLSLAAARQELFRLKALGRPAPPPVSNQEPAAPELFFDFAKLYFRLQKTELAESTFDDYKDEYERRIHPALGHLRLADVTPLRCKLWRAALVEVANSPRMVNTSIAVLRAMLTQAVEDRFLPSNPASGLKRVSDDPDRVGARRVLNEEQLDRLFAGLTLSHETMLRAASEGGLRRGEINGLKWPDVNFAEGSIRVQRGFKRRRTKNKRARTIRISDVYAARLAAWLEQSVVEGGADATGHVWPGRDKPEMGLQTVTQVCRRAQVKAGLVDEDGHPLVTLHGLRHTCASLLLAKGVPLIVVSKHLGHFSVQVTADVYAHLIDDSQMDAVAAVFDGLNEASTLRDHVAGGA